MNDTPSLRREFLRLLRESLLPQRAELRLMLAAEPFAPPADVRVEYSALPQLKTVKGRRSKLVRARWPDAGLVAAHHPYLGCVVEGEADLRVGVMRESTTKAGRPRGGGCYTLQLPAPGCVLFPPGVPHSDGIKAHWERPHPETARSRILWLSFLPEGCILHTCQTKGLEHTGSQGIFIVNRRLLPVAEDLGEELASGSPEIAQTLMRTLLLRIERSLEQTSDDATTATYAQRPGDAGDNRTPSAAQSNSEQIVERACAYIQTHLCAPLTVEDIATHSHISAPQLNRLFRRNLQTSVMQYVGSQRIARARSLLQNTNLSVNRISDELGFRHCTYFSRIFQRHAGCSPTAFRRRQTTAAEESL